MEQGEKDKSLQDLYMQISQDMIKLYYNGFTEEEIDQFESFLRRIFGNLSECEKNELI